MYLNAKEIKKLAEYALGISINENGLGVPDSELEDFEYFIKSNVDIMDDDGSVKNYRFTVSCDGCDFNEVYPISEGEEKE